MGRIVRNSIVLMFAAGWLGAGEASAQYGFAFGPYGWGIGFGFYDPAGRTVNALNQRALIRGQAAYAARAGGLDAPATAGSYFSRVRDDRPAYSRRDVATRDPEERRDSPSTEAPEPEPARPERRGVPLERFFAGGTLVWPSEAPVEGDLGAKREASDRAARAVLEQLHDQGFATVGSVIDARARLVDYGKPALALLGQRATPQIAGMFHAFLLLLYDALQQAGSPVTEAAAGPAPEPGALPRQALDVGAPTARKDRRSRS